MQKKSINLSHRHLLKHKTKQLFYYPIRTSKVLESRQEMQKKKTKENDYETSIDVENQRDVLAEHDTSLGKNVRSQSIGSGKKIMLRGQRIKIGGRRLSGKAHSVQVISKNKLSLNHMRQEFSIKKYKKAPVTASQNKLSPIQNVQPQVTHPTKQSQVFPKSDSYLTLTVKPNLKKSSTAKLKQNMRLKVIDPFEKRMKLDRQFHDQSVVIHNVESNQSCFISTVNREEFMDLLKDIV